MGQPAGLGVFRLALVTHLVSSLDILQQRSFPVFPRVTALAATSVATILFIYLPVAAVLELYAFPAQSEHSTNAGYLVNRLAYEAAEPRAGDWIWLHFHPLVRPGQVWWWGWPVRMWNGQVEDGR